MACGSRLPVMRQCNCPGPWIEQMARHRPQQSLSRAHCFGTSAQTPLSGQRFKQEVPLSGQRFKQEVPLSDLPRVSNPRACSFDGRLSEQQARRRHPWRPQKLSRNQTAASRFMNHGFHRLVASAQEPLPNKEQQSQPQEPARESPSSSPTDARVKIQTQPQPQSAEDQRSQLGGPFPLPPQKKIEAPPSLSPTDVVSWGGTLPSSRRILLGSATATALGLGSNCLNVTSLLLSSGGNAEWARELRLDVVYPVKRLRRYYDASNGFEFLYPEEWLADQRLANMAVRQAELQRPLDPPPLRPRTQQQQYQQQSSEQQQQSQEEGQSRGSLAPSARGLKLVEPLVAFKPRDGPRGLNISVVAQGISGGFRLEDLGDAEVVGAILLDNIIAPPGSNLKSTLISSKVKQVDGVTYAVVDFVIQGQTYERHNKSVFCKADGSLVTLNVQAPESLWAQYQNRFDSVIDSFNLIVK